MDDRTEHWDRTYAHRGTTGVSWFQAVPTPSLHMIDVLGIAPAARMVDVGGGAASLVDQLIARGFTDLTVLDISEVALTAARARVGDQAPVSWVHEDVLTWRPRQRFDLWHDRAVFHFLVDPADQQRYSGDRAREPGLRRGGHHRHVRTRWARSLLRASRRAILRGGPHRAAWQCVHGR